MESLSSNKTCMNGLLEYGRCIPYKNLHDYILEHLVLTWREVILIILFLTVLMGGLMGNGLVCFVIWRNRDMRTFTNVFLVNLAVADLLVLLLVLIPTLLEDMLQTWFSGTIGCKILKFLQKMSVSVSVLTLTAISLERCFGICHPLKFKLTRAHVWVTIAVIWCVSMVLSGPDLYYKMIVPEPRLPANITPLLTTCRDSKNKPKQLFYIYIAVLFVIPFFVITIAYVKVGRTLWVSGVDNQITTDRRNRSYENQLNNRRKITKMLIVVVVCFFCCFIIHYGFQILVSELHILRDNIIVYLTFVRVGHLLIYVNSALNPIIYNFMSEKFRNAFKEICTC